MDELIGKVKVRQWEYEIRFDTHILSSNIRQKEERLNDMGEEGWELVSFVHGADNIAYAIYKRQKI